jgi:hypothetical protein
MQQPKALGRYRRVEDAHAREVAARSVETRHEPNLDGVGPRLKNNRYCLGRCFGRKRRLRVCCDDHRHPTAHQIGGQRRQSISVVFRRPEFNRHVLTLDIAGLLQAQTERRHQSLCVGQRCASEEADNRHSSLLRARRKRPRRRAAEERDELAALHGGLPSFLMRRR